ncbi:MAG: hypothetical protein H8D34_19810 [Chloroflexi bacterium]|nr:hypothetical protein [Chloroflexota bacterium]
MKHNSLIFAIIVVLLVVGCSPTESPEPEITTAAIVEEPTIEPTPEIAQLYQIPDDYDITIKVYGIERTFLLHVPPGYQPGEPAPLVFNLHGAGGSAHGQANRSFMNDKANLENFLVVYPQALHEPATWLGPVSGPASANDNHFFDEMVEYLSAEMSIDAQRIYVAGISNGGTMANHLGCYLSDKIAAVAAVAAGNAHPAGCFLEKPVSVIVFHGTDDVVIPLEGDGGNTAAVQYWVEAWADSNECNLSPSVDQDNEDFKHETWSDCAGNSEVTFYTDKGGLHEWPGSAYGPGPYQEGLEPDLYATDLIWEFFDAHPKSEQVINEPSIDPAILARYENPGDYVDMLPVDGFPRWFTLHVPTGYDPELPTPLLVNLHGYSSTMFDQQEVSEMNAKADQEGFVVVHPQAIGEPASWHGPLPGVEGQIDKDFFVILLEYLNGLINIDQGRIYATGLSNGATMSNALGCFMSDTFAGIAPVAGGHTDFTNCDIERPLSVLAIHGTHDSIIPYEGRENEVPPVHLWVEYWAQRNGCQPEPQIEETEPSLKIETWEGCDEDVTVRLISRIGGAHVWPGSTLAALREDVASEFSATDIIWEFFKENSRDSSE